MPDMAKKKNPAGEERTQDRHTSGRMVRLPDDLYDRLRALAAENNRPVTWEIKMALEEWLKARGR